MVLTFPSPVLITAEEARRDESPAMVRVAKWGGGNQGRRFRLGHSPSPLHISPARGLRSAVSSEANCPKRSPSQIQFGAVYKET